MKLFRALSLIIALCLIALSAPPAFAHGTGHGHGQGTPPAPPAPGDDGEGDEIETEADYDPARVTLVAFLTGGAEVNAAGEPNQGDLDASGIARVRLAPDRGRVCINAEVRNVDPLTLAHIHLGPAGANGPVAVDFTALISGATVKGCVAADPALIHAIIADPAGYYVNLHNAAFRPGAVRGQLEPRGSLRSAFRVELSGAAEVGTPGDPDGSAKARVVVDARDLTVCLNTRARRVAPLTLAHIHNAPAGQNGPVVVDFTQFIDGTRVHGCVAVDPNLLQAIRSSPASYYVNLHNAEFRAGALRGQLR